MDLKIIVIIVLAILVIVIPIIVAVQVTNTVKNDAYIYNLDDIDNNVSTRDPLMMSSQEGDVTTDGLPKNAPIPNAMVYTMTTDVIPMGEGIMMDKVLINNPDGYSFKCSA
jgi:hypothetical protein